MFSKALKSFWMKLDQHGDIPSNRENASFFQQANSNKAYLFGGHNGADLTDIYSFNLISHQWTRLIPNTDTRGEIKAPLSLYGYSCAYWSSKNKLLVFGGCTDIENIGK